MVVNIDWGKFNSKLYMPLVNEDIPDFRPGTISYDDYWDEQDKRCLEGYQPRPYMPKISNEHYFYLNNCKIELLEPGSSRKTPGYPFYREIDRRLFDEIHDAKKSKYGLIIGKPRRVGLSWVGSATTVYEMLMYLRNKVGVAAGLDEKAQDFYEKVKYLLDNIRPEFASGILTKNDELIKLGYLNYENKQKKEEGLLSQLFIKTMFAKPTGFEGQSLSLAIFEEAGLFMDLIAAYKSTEPCFKEGSFQFGTPLVYGTGGEIDKGSKAYRSMWYADREVYNLKKIFISATDYYPGDGIPDKATGEVISFFDFRTGITNSKMAYDWIMKERESKEKSEGFVKHIQSYPLKESDIFIKTSGGALPRKKLQAQLRNQDNCPFLRLKGRLEWNTDDHVTKRLVIKAKSEKEKDKIHFSRGSKVIFIEDAEFGNFTKILDPIDHSKLSYCPEIAGCDSYDEELAEGVGSLGGTVIYRCFYSLSKPYDLPVGYILDRGKGDEDDIFYSTNVKCAVFYGYELLVEYTKIAIINYFKDVGADFKHLKARPVFDSYESKATNQYGFKMPNQHALKFITRLLRKEINDNFQNIWFDELLEHLIDFGESNSDLGSAYGMVVVSKLDLFGSISDGIDEDETDSNPLDDFSYYTVENGKLNVNLYRYVDDDNPDRIDIFDPKKDLEGHEKIEYQQMQNMEKNAILSQQQNILSSYNNDAMAFIIDEYKRDREKNNT